MDQQQQDDSAPPLSFDRNNNNNYHDTDYLNDPQGSRRRQVKARARRTNSLQTPTADPINMNRPQQYAANGGVDILIASSMLFPSSSLVDHPSYDHTTKNSHGRLIRRNSNKRQTSEQGSAPAIYRHNQMRVASSLLRCNNNNEDVDDDDRGNKTTATTITIRRHDGRRLMLICAIFALLYCVLNIVCIQPTKAIRLQPEGREKFYWSGEQFVITCQNNNNIKNVKMRWIGPDGRQITEDRSQRVHAESTGPHGHRLVVMNATSEVDDGQYNCTLGSTDDRQPREYIGFNLKIFMTTNFKDTAQHLVLTAGQPGTLTCRVEFDPNASGSINWFRDQKPIEVFNDTHYKTIDYDPSKQYSQLVMSPVTKQNDGTYTCRAVAVTSQLSKINDFDIRLETNYGPEFDKDRETVWVERIGQSTANRYLLIPAHLSDRYGAGSSSAHPFVHHSHHQTMLPPGMLLGAAAVAGAAATAGMRNQHHQQPQPQQQQQPAQQTQMPHPQPNPQQYPHQPTTTHMGRGRVGGGRGGKRGRAFAPEVDQTGGYDHMSTMESVSNLSSSSNSTGQVIRVELRCSCRANPQASILWISTNSQFELAKGQPAHIIEQPTTEYDGHNATSTLTIAYNLDPDWPHRHDAYYCSASNRIGKAKKRYTIVQGDPPPAYEIGPYKEYDSERSLFKFTLLGPNFDPVKSNAELTKGQSPSSASVNNNNNLGDSISFEIVPPVDSFRIRAESPAGGIQMQQPSSSGGSMDHRGGGHPTTRYHTQQHSTATTGGRSSTAATAPRRTTSATGSSEPVASVEWSVVMTSETARGDGLALVGRNQTVNLGKLPSGHQRLYLEAHNAVGWSPNATYIGDYYIVSSASSLHLSGLLLLSIYLLTTLSLPTIRLP